MFTVKFGVGEEYPGEVCKEKSVGSEEACFTDEMRKLFQAAQASISDEDEDSFVWISVVDASGDSLFEIEDKLTEWLDD